MTYLKGVNSQEMVWGMPESIACKVSFADIAAARPEHACLLNAVEQERQARYRFAADRARFTLGAVLLRLVAARELKMPARDVPVDRACERCGAQHGKPRIAGSDLHVSVSHSGALVAIALCRKAPVGIDVEAITERDLTGLSQTLLAEDEYIRTPTDFYAYWSRKEAVVKATGDGLRIPFGEIAVTAPHEPARLLAYRGAPLAASLADLKCPPGYAGAVAVLAPGGISITIGTRPLISWRK